MDSRAARGAAGRGLRALLSAFALCPLAGEAAPPPAPDGKEWVLVWSDEFDGTALDAAKWGSRGEALRQDRYQNGHRVQWRYEDDNVAVRDGTLVLRNTRESVSDGDDSWDLLKAAAVASKGKFERTYGYFEASVRIAPTLDGVHTAFWVQNDARRGTSSNGGVDGPSDGAEIDILESVYVTPHYHMAVHWDGGQTASAIRAFTPMQDGGFHVFAVAWSPAGYVFYADGESMWDTSRGVSDSDGYVILSTGASWQDGNVRTGTFPNEARVDWVRVYALRDAGRVNAAPSGRPTVSGSPVVGAVLVASAADIDDADGLTAPGFAWQWIAHDGTSDADIANATGDRYALSAAEAGKSVKVRVAFTDDGGSEETLVSEATAAVAWPPLGASFKDVPAGHDGTPFAAGLEFAEEVDDVSYVWVRDALAAAAEGTVLRAERTAPPRNRSWRLTVEPASAGADVVLSTAAGATLPDGRAVAPAAPATVPGQSLSVADAAGDEGGTATFAVTLDRGASGAVAVEYATSDGTAAAGRDYGAASGRLRFAAGERAKTVAVALLADAAAEDDETFSLTLSNPRGAALADASATGTVRDVPPPRPSLSVADAVAPEGGTATFALTLEPAAAGEVAAFYTTAPGTATAGADYTGTWGTLTFAAGETSGTVAVAVLDDDEAEFDETFRLELISVKGAAYADPTGTATIEDDDAPAARLRAVPAEHGGEDRAFEAGLEFDEEIADIGYAWVRDTLATATGGTVARARRTVGNPPENRSWRLTVTPASSGDVVLGLVPGLRVPDGRPLRVGGAATVRGPAAQGASVDGARLTLVWPSARDGFGTPSGSDYAVAVNGAPRAVASAEIAGRRAVLVLSAPVGAADAVAVGYVGSAMHPLADASGTVRSAPWGGVAANNATGKAADAAAAAPPPKPAAARLAAAPADAVRLDAAGLGLADLSALAEFTALERLDLSDNALADLRGIGAHGALRELDLSGNRIADLGPLRALHGLERLDLSGNRVADVAPLAGLPSLAVLVLDGNAVADLGALTHLAALEHLSLAGNAVPDVTPLQDLARLRRLDLGGNPVADLSPLGDVGALEWLALPGERAAAADALVRLTGLRWVWPGAAATK